MAPLRDTGRAVTALSALAVLAGGAVAAGGAAARPWSAPLGGLAILALASGRPRFMRWAPALLVAQLATALAGAHTVQPLAVVAAPALVAGTELAFAALELRDASAEDPALLRDRLRAATEAAALACAAAFVAAGLAAAPLPHGVGSTIAGLLGAGAAAALLSRVSVSRNDEAPPARRRRPRRPG